MQHIILSPGCSTVDNKPCIFPLKYYGKIYNECTSLDATKDWCSYEVKPDGSYMPGKWSYCSEDCLQLKSTTTKEGNFVIIYVLLLFRFPLQHAQRTVCDPQSQKKILLYAAYNSVPSMFSH